MHRVEQRGLGHFGDRHGRMAKSLVPCLCVSAAQQNSIFINQRWNLVESSPSIFPHSSSSPYLIFTISPGYFSSLTQKSLLLIGTNEYMVPVFLILSYPPYVVCKESCWSSSQDRSPFHRCGTAPFWTE